MRRWKDNHETGLEQNAGWLQYRLQGATFVNNEMNQVVRKA